MSSKPTKAFLDGLRKVQIRLTPDLALINAHSDRVRVSTPAHSDVGGVVEEDQKLREGTNKHFKDSFIRFRDRVSREQKLTEANDRYYDYHADVIQTPEEYFDYCFVFNTHPADLDCPEEMPPIELSALSKEHEHLQSVTLNRDEIRHYLARVCCYRDLDSMDTKASALQTEAQPNQTYFSSFSMAIHHDPDAGESIFSQSRWGDLLRSLLAPRQHHSDAARRLPTAIELQSYESIPEEEAEEDPPAEPPANTSARSSADTPTAKLMSPPLALVRDTFDSQSAFRYASAGASTLPNFYGMADFLDLLDRADPRFTMTALDFTLLVRELFISCLRKAGADVSESLSFDRVHLMVKVRMREPAARRVANHIEYVMTTNENATEHEYIRGNLMSAGSTPHIAFDESAEEIGNGYYAARQKRAIWRRYDGLNREIKLPFSRFASRQGRAKETVEDLHEYHGISLRDASIFRDIDRIRLLNYVMNFHFDFSVLTTPFDCKASKCRVRRGQATLVPPTDHGSAAVMPAVLLSHFALHKRHIQAELRDSWASIRFALSTAQPLDRVRDYFGEQIAFYFLWTGFLTDALKWPSLLGCIVFICQWVLAPRGRLESPLAVLITLSWATYISIWSSRFSVRWQTEERFWRLKWGMDVERLAHKIERPNYIFDYFVVDPLNPRRFTKYYPAAKSTTRAVLSALVTIMSMAVIVSCVVGIYALRGYFASHITGTFTWLARHESTVISSLQALQIVLLDYLWCATVKWQTDFENHRFERDHQRSVISKMFLFRFTNNFYALMYIAFFKNYIEPCAPDEEGGCMGYFQLQVFILYLLFYAFNLVELGIPLGAFWCRKHRLNVQDAHDFVEIQSLLSPYEPQALVEDYMEIVIQYCAVVFFSIALPIVPLFAYVQNLLEIRVDAYKLCQCTRRAFPHVAPDGLSMYNDIISLIGVIAAPMNVALCIFLIPFGHGIIPLGSKLLAFILAEHFLLLVRTYVSFNGSTNGVSYDALREAMRMATHEIVWGNANSLRFGESGPRTPRTDTLRQLSPARIGE